MAVLVLPFLDALARDLVRPKDGSSVDFTQPAGERALVPSDSVSWQIFKNPVALFVGGVTAVILELADPAVRTGVWHHSSFRQDPVHRLRRTGLAAMITVYGGESEARAMIANVVRVHPPLVISDADLDEALNAVTEGVETLTAARAG